MKTEFALSHNNDDKNEIWKAELVEMLLSEKLLPYFKGFYETDKGESISAYIIAPTRKFKKFVKKNGLEVDQVIQGIKFMKGAIKF